MGIDAEMFVRTRQGYTEQQVLEMAVDLAECFGPDRFWIFKEPSWGKPHHCLSLVGVWEQDGPDVQPEQGEQFIKVHLGTRYYGPGYERGDLPLILNVAKWLRERIPDATIWYGGDSSGVCAEPLDDEALWRHFVRNGHRPYLGYFGAFGPRGSKPKAICSFCAGKEMYNSGGGGGDNYWNCGGCGQRLIETADGVLHPVGQHEELFKAHSRVKAGIPLDPKEN